MASKMKKKDIDEYIKSKSVTQSSYTAPTVQTHVDTRAPAMVQAAQTVEPTVKVAQTNFKNAENDLNLAQSRYETALANELKKTGKDYRIKFDDFTKNKISYQTKEQDKENATPKIEKIPIQEANKNLQNELADVQDKFDKWKIANYENNLAKAQSKPVTLWDKTGGNVTRALQDLVSPLTQGEAYEMKDEKGNKTYLPSYNELRQQEVQSSYGDNLIGKAAKFGGDVVYGGTKILGTSGIDALTGGIGGKVLYWTDMATDNYKKVKNEGYSDKQALANTAIATGTEFLTEKLLGGLAGRLTGGEASTVENAVSKAVSKVVSNPQAAKLIGSMTSEGLEEFTQEYIGALNDKITLGKDTNLEDLIKDSLYSGLVGAGTAGAVEGGINLINVARPSFNQNNQPIQNQETPIQAPITQNNINAQEQVETAPTRQENGQITPQQVQTRVEPQTTETKPVAKLTQQEQQELNTLKDSPFELDEQQERRMDELLLKQNKDLEKKMSPVRDLSDVRDFSEVGSSKINAYQYDNPEVKPYFQEVAKDMLYDLDNSTKGERYMTEDGQFKGIKRNVPNDIAELLDGENGVKYSYKEIEDGLNAIIKDNGAENKAVAKRLEFYIDQRLRNGYIDSIVGKIPANSEYIETLRNKNAGENPNIPAEMEREPVLKVETKGEKGKQFFEEQGAKPEVAKILSETPRKEKLTLKEKTKNFIENQKNSLKEFRRSFVDKGQEIADIDRAVKDNGKTYAKYDFLALSDANAQYQIGDGQTTTDGKLFKNFTDKDGNKVSKSLKGLWEDVDNAGLKDVMDEYIAHYLNTDVYGRPTASSQRETDSILNMVESGFISPEEAKSIIDKNKKIQSVFGEAVTKKDSLKRIKEIEQQHPEIKRLAENIWQYGYNELDKMVDSGRVSKTDAEKFKKENPHYVRLQRKVEQTKKSQDIFDINKKADVSVGKGIQERKGGTQDILPFRDTMADFTRFNARQSRMNNFGLKLAQVLNTNIDANDSLVSTDLEDLIKDSFESGVKLGDTIKKNDNGTYTFRIYENGKPKQIYINEGIYEALQPNKKYKLEEWLPFKATAKLSKVQRDLITGKNLLFSTTNAPKDFFNALFSTRNSSQQFLKNYFKAYAELAKNGDYAQQYKALGGNQNTYYNYEEGYIKDKSKIKALKAGQSIINGIERINNFVETAPRLAEFMSSMENGKSIEDAMYDAAEVTTNFKRGGNVTKAIDRIGANYFSPSVQGASKFVRNFSEAIENKQYAKILTRVALMGLGPALVGEIMWGDDEDYKDLPEYQKDNYYLWKTGEGKWIRIPKGQIQGALQAPIRRTIVATRGQEDAYSGLTDTFLNNVAPNNPLEDNVLGPMISVARNKSWSGNPIVPSYKENRKHPEVEYTSGTDELSKYLGEKLHKSPAKINYLLDQYTGGIGDLVLPNITNKTTQENNNALAKVTNPLKSKFTTDTTYSNKAQGNFYDAFEDAKNDNDERWKGRTEADSVRYKYLYSKNLELAEINKQIEEVQSSNIDKDEKYKQVAELRKKLNNLAKESVKESKNIKENEYYMQIDDYYYYKYKEKDGSITYKKATDKQLEKNKYALADYFKEMYEKSTKR